MVNSLRDGMNLIGKEFASCNISEDGVLILSELTGAADELSEYLEPAGGLAFDAVFRATLATYLGPRESSPRSRPPGVAHSVTRRRVFGILI